MMNITTGMKVLAKWSAGRADAMVWTVRGVTEHGIYITSPGSRSPGHLLSEKDFSRDYLRVDPHAHLRYPSYLEACPPAGK